MNKYLCLFFVLFIASCTNKPNNPALENQFNALKAAYNSQSEASFMTADVWQSLQATRNNSNQSAFTHALSLFPNEIINITDNKEAIKGDSGCLLVSGTNSDNIPMDYYISYRYTDSSWVIDSVTSKYFLDSEKRFLQTAECSQEKRMKLWMAQH